MQYNKEQLTGKSIEELRSIAEGFGINAQKLGELDLIYEILDESAKASAQDRSAAKTTPANRKRARLKTVDRVYTANQQKAKKVDKTMKMSVDDSLFGSLSPEEKSLMVKAQESEKNAAKAEKAAESAAAKAGGAQTDAPAPADKGATADAQAPRKGRGRGRGKKGGDAEKPAQPEAAGGTEATASADASKTTDKAAEKTQKTQKTDNANMRNDKNEGGRKDTKSASENIPAAADAQQGNGVKNGALDTAVPEASAANDGYRPTEKLVPVQQAKMRRAIGEQDFFILEDIPSEDSVLNIGLEDFFRLGRESGSGHGGGNQGNGRGNHASGASRAEAQSLAAMPQLAKEKPYDFGELIVVTGVFEMVDNYGFLRSSDYNYLPSPDDVYVNPSQVRAHGLKTGDVVECTVRPPREGEKFFPMVSVKKINGCDPSVVRDRVAFEYLTPLFPDEKFKLCVGDGSDSQSSRIVDLFSPIGKGQRALIVAQPKTGKTLLMKDIANSIARNHPEAYLIMLLIDERPEEVTDMARTVNAEVVASTFDAPAESHVKIAGLVLEKAKRMVECGHDVVIFLDSITRLARAYNTVSPASGKVLSGGVDANALQKPKRFFGAARNIEGGGSLTIIATALIDTGSKMDEVIFEEFKGTGNMELQLDRTLANKRVFPAVNLTASSTRRDDLLQDQTTLNRMWILRKHIADMTSMEAMDLMKNYMERTKNNEELLLSMNG